MKGRLKQLRKELNLTQTEFAKRIGSSQNVVANYEIGRRNPSASVINNICKEFNVNETWLRTGEGEMFIELDPEDELMQWAEKNLTTKSDSFKKRFVRMLARMTDEEWEWMEQKLLELVPEPPTSDSAPVEPVLLATHARTDKTPTPEGQKHDLDIMMDDSNGSDRK